MPDDPTKTKEDRKLVSSSSQQEYEIDDFASKYDLSRGEAATIIKRYGSSRSKLDAIMAQRFYG
ncbi:hypothetical protein Amn_pb01610 (plasmid) [Aminobacter sp. Y103A]|jgi:hypothetical protein|uniref:DUF3606 domain-containing protein n=1 Tax=Aminobacter aminovorans TaxID=83263 RepID=A0AAC8YVJ2_AMIAI|nr:MULTISPECIES: DUF3606 domain-containing protein [Aminobacter]AMS45215.1 hypothetical protein AA2016_6319 [Aminobacter aminovorans]MBB3705024.1 hypothetical protein [Aminobacter aminovorans]BBD41170.1 hypothetical protein Amn_pb01610 [Aminobacter sp. SS-2016]